MRLGFSVIFLTFFLGGRLTAQDAKAERPEQTALTLTDSVSVGEGEGLKTLPVEIMKDGALTGLTSTVSHPAGTVFITVNATSPPTDRQYRLFLLHATKGLREIIPGSRAPVLIFFSMKAGVYQTSVKLEKGQWAIVSGDKAYTLEVR